MKYNQSTFDGEPHFDDRAHQLFCVQLAEWIYQSQSKDSGISIEMVNSISDSWVVIYHNDYCDSPIEYLLLSALMFQTNGYEYLSVHPWDFVEAMHGGDIDQLLPADVKSVVIPQAKIGKYRVDFLIVTKVCDEIHKVIIECDGHAYHDKTKEQATKDKKRDRDITSIGIPTLRFTGSDIYNKPLGCGQEIADYLFKSIESSLIRQEKLGGKK